jgi:ankyrin repeat protein
VFENDHGPTSFRETQGFDPAKCSQEGIGSLQLAAYFAKTTDTLKVILETGAFDVNRVDENGDTALFYALAGYNSPGNVCHLIEKGADPDIANRKNVTPMNVVGTGRMKELEDIMKEKRRIYLNSVAPSPTAVRNAADDTSGDDDQPDPEHSRLCVTHPQQTRTIREAFLWSEEIWHKEMV